MPTRHYHLPKADFIQAPLGLHPTLSDFIALREISFFSPLRPAQLYDTDLAQSFRNFAAPTYHKVYATLRRCPSTELSQLCGAAATLHCAEHIVGLQLNSDSAYCSARRTELASYKGAIALIALRGVQSSGCTGLR